MPNIYTAALFAVCYTSFVTSGAEFGTYVLGSTGLRGGSVSPPGVYALSLNFFYHADQIHDEHGDRVSRVAGLNFDSTADAYLNISGITYISKFKIFGANYGVRLINTAGDLELDTEVGPIRNHQKKVGNADLYLEPINLSWHLKRFDLFASYGFYSPLGGFDKNDPISTTDRFSHLFSAGMTAYLDEKKKWAVAIVPRYEIYHHNIHRDVTAGQDALFEWGISRTLKFIDKDTKKHWGTLDVGPVGYATWKVTSDEGPAASNARYSIFASGLEASFTKVDWHSSRFSVRFEKEFEAHSRPQGQMAMFTFAVKF